MLRIAAVCGSGLGTSFMMEMNIQSILKEKGIDSNLVQVSHYDLGSATSSEADVWVVGRDLESSVGHLGDVKVLNSIIDKNELEMVVQQILEENNLL